jgi:DNA-directed RNA polymerase subunit RPC12/RpoP
MGKCANCNKEYKEFMLSNYNLSLCSECFEKLEETAIQRDSSIDKVTHKITCPKCKKTYKFICDEKCKTEGCNVWFFWDELDCMVFARWLDK